MKKLLLLIVILFSFSGTVKSSHIVGGEIYWKCLPTGKFIFYMNVFRECQSPSIQYDFSERTLDINGSPLPTNGITSILMKSDSVKWINSNYGDASPDCSSTYAAPYTCGSGFAPGIQVFPYVSDPVMLTGAPPPSGWRITWLAPCCRPNPGVFDNITTSGDMLLRSIMFPGLNGLSTFPCFDSSPEFKASPTSLICKNSLFTYNHTVIDEDLDSLVYTWDQTYNGPANNPVPLPFVAPYTKNTPTPGPSQNINNISATLDPLTGSTNMAVYSGGNIQKFLTIVRVDAYRSSSGATTPKLVASVFRELPITVVACNTFPNGNVNYVPQVKINGVPTNSIVTTVVAGQTVSAPIAVEDNDLTGVGQQLQTLTLIPEGVMFSKSKTAPDRSSPGVNPCLIPSAEPCAYLRNSDPSIGVSPSPQVPIIKGLGAINTEFVWQTSCNHIQTSTGVPGTNQGIYNFVMKVYDDHCPVPALNYPTITIRVKEPIPLTDPVLKGVSVNLDGTASYSWVPPIDSANQFNGSPSSGRYESEYARVDINQSPMNWFVLNSNVKNYKQESLAADFSPYNLNNLLNPNSGYNILDLLGSQLGKRYQHYVRMKTLSGCTSNSFSTWSEPVKIMVLNATDGSDFNQNPRSATHLSWNRARPISINSKPYWKFESFTKYYIHANDSFASGKLTDSLSWYEVGSTYDTTFTIGGSSCENFIAYRIEARDTVITYQSGVSLQSNQLDTLVFSTFSTVDTFYISEPKPRVTSIGYSVLTTDLNRGTFNWFNCNTNAIIPSTNSQNFSPTEQGTYSVIASNDLNNPFCNDTSDCFTTVVLNDSVSIFNNDSLVSESVEANYQWFDCRTGLPITRETNRYFTPSDTGLYQLVVSAYGYSDTSDCIPMFAVGIKENYFQESVSFSPNPTSGSILIRLERMYQKIDIRVRNLQGQLVQEDQFRSTRNIELDIQAKAGVYFVELLNEKGEKANLKVVKE